MSEYEYVPAVISTDEIREAGHRILGINALYPNSISQMLEALANLMTAAGSSLAAAGMSDEIHMDMMITAFIIHGRWQEAEMIAEGMMTGRTALARLEVKDLDADPTLLDKTLDRLLWQAKSPDN